MLRKWPLNLFYYMKPLSLYNKEFQERNSYSNLSTVLLFSAQGRVEYGKICFCVLYLMQMHYIFLYSRSAHVMINLSSSKLDAQLKIAQYAEILPRKNRKRFDMDRLTQVYITLLLLQIDEPYALTSSGHHLRSALMKKQLTRTDLYA